jgi:pimeloyl-ACP methyl ester carboxylesterase
MRYFARSHRCVTFSQRGYPPSDIPDDPASYGQDIMRGDIIAVMNALGIDKAHVVGHSMGAYGALHVGMRHPERCISVTAAGCGWGSLPDPAARAAMRAQAAETAKMFVEKGMAAAAVIYTAGATRQAQKYKDPRGYDEFVRMFAEHSALGQSLTMTSVQSKRPTLWDLEADLKKFSVPLLIICGDEDETCLDGSVFLKRTAPAAGLLVIPRAGHTITSEEPDAVNAALADLFAAAESGRWLAHKPPA